SERAHRSRHGTGPSPVWRRARSRGSRGSAEAERLAPQGHRGDDVGRLDLDADEGAGLRVAAAAVQADGGVGPGDRAAVAAELVAGHVRLAAEVVGLLDVEDVERLGLPGAEGQIAAAGGADAAGDGVTAPVQAAVDAAADAATGDVDL